MTKFISEVSSNHSKSLDRCFKFIDESADIGCYGVKFQLFLIDQLFSAEVIAKRKDIQARREWELPVSFLPEIKKRCEANKIKFGCTPFYLDAVDILDDYVDFFKIASYEILWLDLIRKCAMNPEKDLILSSGMATMDEVSTAFNTYKNINNKSPSLMHCTSIYPANLDEVNLAAIKTMKDNFGCEVGWSDHSTSKEVITSAVLKWGADTIEFHLDLEGDGAEFSSGHCWLPKDIEDVISFLSKCELTDGSAEKVPHKKEMEERVWRADPTDGLRPFKEMRNK